MTLTKTIFREKCIKKLKSISKHNQLCRDSIINKKLQITLKRLKSKNILFYYPLNMEADIRKTINNMRKKYNIFIPFMLSESFKMVPFRLPLKRSKFGTYESGNSLRNIQNIDIAIVPIIGLDGNLQRVGFGKGMYDYFFAKLKKKPYTIFIQSKLCITKEKICDIYDISCDEIITSDIK